MSYTAEVTEVTYTDPAHNSDKFYRAYILSDDDASDYRVVFQWGRRGAKGQSQNSVYPQKHLAERAAHNKLLSKMDKGYERTYHRELPAVSNDILELAGVNPFAGRTDKPNPDPFVRLTVEVDRARRLAMGDASDVVEAITVRKSLLDQLAELRTSVAKAEGEVEIIDMLLAAKVG